MRSVMKLLLLFSSAQGELPDCSLPVQQLLPDPGQPADRAHALPGKTDQPYEEPE